jgi:prepilin-type N-terminal cleavage/methylation domain-containing protein
MVYLHQRPARGFTLIELLVVIAIIGILSSVVLASLAVARLKGADGAVKSDLHTIQTQMELYYDNNGNSYGTALAKQSSPSATIISRAGQPDGYSSDPTIKNALSGAISQGGPGCWSIGVGGASYAVAIPLRADSTYYWCLDSSGSAKKVLASDFAGPGCPAAMGTASTIAACPNP